jgi:hypothetical protein
MGDRQLALCQRPAACPRSVSCRLADWRCSPYQVGYRFLHLADCPVLADCRMRAACWECGSRSCRRWGDLTTRVNRMVATSKVCERRHNHHRGSRHRIRHDFHRPPRDTPPHHLRSRRPRRRASRRPHRRRRARPHRHPLHHGRRGPRDRSTSTDKRQSGQLRLRLPFSLQHLSPNPFFVIRRIPVTNLAGHSLRFRTTSISSIFGSTSPPTTRLIDCHVKELSSTYL